MNSRKQVIANIARIEQKLVAQQAENLEHECSIRNFIQHYKVLMVVSVATAFLAGWKFGFKAGVGRLVGKSLEFAAFLRRLNLV